MNDLTPFEINGDRILSWARDVEKVYPDIDLEKISFLILCFKTEQIMWDDRKGIQNIFNGLRQIVSEGSEYRVLKMIY